MASKFSPTPLDPQAHADKTTAMFKHLNQSNNELFAVANDLSYAGHRLYNSCADKVLESCHKPETEVMQVLACPDVEITTGNKRYGPNSSTQYTPLPLSSSTALL